MLPTAKIIRFPGRGRVLARSIGHPAGSALRAPRIQEEARGEPFAIASLELRHEPDAPLPREHVLER